MDLYFYYARSMPDGRWTPQMAFFHPDSLSTTRNQKGQPPRHAPPLGQSEAMVLNGGDVHLSLTELVARYPAPAHVVPAAPPDMRKPRAGEQIGGGYSVFRLGRRSRRIRPAEFPFEHPSLALAEAAAQKLANQNPGQTYEVWSVMTRFSYAVAPHQPSPATQAEASP